MKNRSLFFTEIGKAEIREEEVTRPQTGELLVNTSINGICAFELHTFSGDLPVDWLPAVMGHEAVGVVTDVGSGVSRFKPGDKVSTLGFSNYRDYYCVHENQASAVPEDETDLHLWLGEPPACAVNAVRLIEQRNPGDKVAVIGCGFMGLLLVQLASKRGMEVRAVDLNPERVKLAEQFGAIAENPDPESQDVVIECSGSAKALELSEDLLRNGGILCLFAHHLPTRVCNTNVWHMKGLDILNATPMASRDWTRDFHDAVEYIRQGTFDLKPLVTHFYHVDEAQEALTSILQARPETYIKGIFRFN